MNANIMTKRIEMTKSEAAAAGKCNSKEFDELKELREMFPDFSITVVKSKSKRVDRFKGLDYDYMKSYIERNKSELLSQFYVLRGLDAEGKKKEALSATASYGEIKMWFLTEFPEIEKLADNVNAIMETTRKKRAEQKKTV
jgi:hypothetical protein